MTKDGLKKELSGFTKDELIEVLVDSVIKGGDSGGYSFIDFKENLKRIRRENAIKEAESERDRAFDEFAKAKAAVADAEDKMVAKIGKKPGEVTFKDAVKNSSSEDLMDYLKKLERVEKAAEKYGKAYNRYIDVQVGEE